MLTGTFVVNICSFDNNQEQVTPHIIHEKYLFSKHVLTG